MLSDDLAAAERVVRRAFDDAETAWAQARDKHNTLHISGAEHELVAEAASRLDGRRGHDPAHGA